MSKKCIVPCPRCPYGGAKIGSRGNPEAKIVIIGESPSSKDLSTGVPMSGQAGTVLWASLPQHIRKGIDIDRDVLLLNSTQCLPPKTKDSRINLKNTEVAAVICSRRLLDEVAAHPRDIIITLGNFASRAILGDPNFKITQARGQLRASEYASIGVMPVINPAALLRGTGNFRQFRNDVENAFQLARGIPMKKSVQGKYIEIDTPAEFLEAVRDLMQAPAIACDVETSGFYWMQDRLLCLIMTPLPEYSYIFPPKYIPALNSLFKRARRTGQAIIWQNGKFDMHFMSSQCPDVFVGEDTMLLSYALDEQGGIHDLETIGSDYIGAPDYKGMLDPWVKGKGGSYANVPKDVLYQYGGYDGSNTLQIWQALRPKVAADTHLEKLYTKVLIPASEILFHTEHRGILVDKEALDANDTRLGSIEETEKQALWAICDKMGIERINPNSPAQVAGVIYGHLKLGKKGETSTAKEILDKLPPHPFVLGLRAFRKANKARSTYVTSIRNAIQPDGAIHTTFKIHGTRTGRLSSSDPNMQNIPRDVKVRSQFVARPGYIFVKVDLNQAELRSLAALSNDRFLVPLYKEGKRSLHKETARDFYPHWEGDSTVQGKEELMRAKAVNFGIVYGREAPSIAQEFDLPTQEAQRFIDLWFRRSPEAAAYIASCRAAVLKGATLLTPFGRKKRHQLVTIDNLNALQNEASNFPHQSVASDICLTAAHKAAPILLSRGIYPVNLVHDEFMVEAPDKPEDIQFAIDTIVKCMEEIPREFGITVVPFKAEPDVGYRWGVWEH